MAWTREQRARLLQEAIEIADRLRPPRGRDLKPAERKPLLERRKSLWLEYAENLPRFATHRCPICSEIVEMPVDDVGLDGPWWWKLCPIPLPEPQACEHLQVILGALDLRGRNPDEARNGVMPGPGAPYVVPRLLSLPGVKAVLSSLRLQTGDLAYPVAYFAPEPLESKDMHQEWRREFYIVKNEDGAPVGSDARYDVWDFDIDAWVERGALLWIAPGDTSIELHAEVPSPYRGLGGTHAFQEIAGGRIEFRPEPDGRESAFFVSEASED